MFASEIAWQSMLDEKSAKSLDEILCDPGLAARFDKVAGRFAPGHKPLEYRWAALKLRKEAKYARSRAKVLTPPRLGPVVPIDELAARSLPDVAGLYVLSEDSKNTANLYVGETLNLRSRLKLNRRRVKAWCEFSPSRSIFVQMLPMDCSTAGKLAWQSRLVKELDPRLNCFELRSAS